MERKKTTPEDRHPERVRFPPSRLYLDDLEAVVQVMQREAEAIVEGRDRLGEVEAVVTIHAGERTTQDVEDLRGATVRERRNISLVAVERSEYGDSNLAEAHFSSGSVTAWRKHGRQMLPDLLEAVAPFRARWRLTSGQRFMLGAALVAVACVWAFLGGLFWLQALVYLPGLAILFAVGRYSRVVVVPIRRAAAHEHSLSRRQALTVGLTTSVSGGALGFFLGRLDDGAGQTPDEPR